MLKLADLAAIAAMARRRDVLCASTIPLLRRICSDAEFRIRPGHAFGHQVPEWHSDVVNGVLVVGDNPSLADRLAFLQNSVVPSPVRLTPSLRCAV